MAHKILVVDDEAEIADLIETYLAEEDYTIFKFYSAKEALACIETTDLDLAILDVMLPEVDGFELMEYIRPLEIPVIFLTAKGAVADRVKGLRLGAEEVSVVYRRSMEELPARAEEVEHAKEEGIIFKTLCNPVEIFADENDDVNKIRCIRMELGESDASGRRRPIEVPDSEFDLDVDCVIMSLGTSPNPLIKSTTKGLEINKRGGIIVNEDGLTSREAVYAGGDAVTGAATVILAMGAGKTAAKAIDEYLQKK